jgi:hypothetical protein
LTRRAFSWKFTRATAAARGTLEAFRKEAAGHGKEAPSWIAGQCLARADDWVPHLVLGEYGDRAGLARACELLGAKAEPTPKDRHARFLGKRVLGSRFLVAELMPEAGTHLDVALELATVAKLPREARAPLVYDLACCHARSGKADEALKQLKKAIKFDQSLRDLAREDKAFDSLKDLKAFKNLVKS